MRTAHIRLILPALALLLALPLAANAQIGVGVSITVAPPAIPVYEQPEMPADGYLWTPGFWQWGPDGYYWVPGTWVEPPSVGLLWTPGYWGWSDGIYIFHGGYWGPHVGFYGGVNYGYGYGGAGFEGGYWRGGGFYYNRAVMNVGSVHVTNVYNKTVIVHNDNRVSFNGGAGGIAARPTQGELAAAHDRHIEPTPMQRQHVQAAGSNRALLATVNHGAPAIAATPKPGVFSGRGVVTASHAGPANHEAPAAHEAPASHPIPERMHTDRPPTAAAVHTAPPAPAVTHENVAHPAPAMRPEVPTPAERPQAKAMVAHPPVAAHAQPQPQMHHAAPPSQQAPKAKPAGHDDKRD